MEETIFKCSDCGNEIGEKQTHCLICNSTNKTVTLNFEDSLTVRDKLSGKVKDYSKLSKKRVTIEFISGSEQSKNGNWVEKERIIDRDQNKYFEKVIDENGNDIHFCSEKLTEHFGHGSAKFPKNN